MGLQSKTGAFFFNPTALGRVRSECKFNMIMCVFSLYYFHYSSVQCHCSALFETCLLSTVPPCWRDTQQTWKEVCKRLSVRLLASQPVRLSVNKSVIQSVSQSFKQIETVSKSVSQSANQSACQLIIQIITKLVCWSAIQSVSQSVSQLLGHSFSQSVSQSVSYWVIQSVSQQVSHSNRL